MPSTITSVARIGRPFAIPPSSEKTPVPVRVSIIPATRKRPAETSPWLTECRTAPSRPRSLTAKMPSTIRPIWPIDEYAITPRASGWRKARTEP